MSITTSSTEVRRLLRYVLPGMILIGKMNGKCSPNLSLLNFKVKVTAKQMNFVDF